jgi:prepilin-type processing-associated H-X9-DG protein/prepilin-type N-terminal cleavage/methylation domain-containing protein
MVGAGLGRPEPEYDLDRFKSEPKPPPQSSELSDEERKHLEELEAEMMAGLAGASQDVQVSGAAQSGTQVRTLSSEQASSTAEGIADDKAYAGQYYPVEQKAPHGFTIVELLVVIGILLLLTAILLPMLSRAREQGRTVNCASNLRQVGAGLEMYNQVHKHLPLDGTPASLSRAMDEMNVQGVMVCPADPGGSPSYAMAALFAGLPKSAGNPTDTLATESGNRHPGGPNILYSDGHVEERQ